MRSFDVGPDDTTDAALVVAALAGDVESYGRLIARYASMAHRTAHMLGAGDDAEDVVQEAFVKAYLALDRFRTDDPFRPWLLTIVANEARNRWRWRSRHRSVSLSLVDEHDSLEAALDPQRVAEQREESLALRSAIDRLPKPQREVVVCRYLLDLSEQDTSQILRVPRGTVKSRLSRALRALETVLGPVLHRRVAQPEQSDV